MTGIEPGDRVLDVACGTGVLACAAAERVGSGGAVTGLDPNQDMLSVARGKSPRIAWQEGFAESLPFAEASFDRVASQFGLMFFEDKAAGLREMMRVLRPGGRMAVAVCDALDHSPGYAVLAELLQRLFGAAVADAFRAPFALGERKTLRFLCEQAGLSTAQVARAEGTVRFRSVEQLVSTERACVWTLGGLLDERQFDRLLDEAEESLHPFVTADGAVIFSMPALVITADKA
jgi:SAM-dependent methyltransferase